jgi:NAD(P)-dependent dehydrogenase (short-subunit alcohol dehydrogenase family)
MDIRGRTALVTGAAIGTGRAIALAPAQRGATVVAVDVDTAGGRETERRGSGAVRSRPSTSPMSTQSTIS